MPQPHINYLKVRFEDQRFEIQVDETMVSSAHPILEKMDRDLDQGWQLAREFIANPTRLHRCQIAANRLASALQSENHASANLMAAFIRWKMPEAIQVEIDHGGEDQHTVFFDAQDNAIV